MTQTLLTVTAFVLLLAMVPMGIKWLQSRMPRAGVPSGAASRVLSAVAVGPQQRVVTVEVGPPDGRVCLVLGVTAQAVSCLYTMPARPRPAVQAELETTSMHQPSMSRLP